MSSSADGLALPLSGVRVLDLTRLLPGNYATLLLVGLGADVIKIEDTSGGDGTRMAPPFVGASSAAHATLNRGKRSVQLDLKNDVDRDVFLSLLAVCDVLVDSFRPGVLDRLSLSDAAIAAVNPRLVHVSLVAYADAARRTHAGHDLNAQALSGVISLTGGHDGEPAIPGVQLADLAAGSDVALAVVSGLFATHSGRRTSDSPFRVHVSMLESAYSMLGLAGAQGAVAILGESEDPGPDQFLSGGLACYNLYCCADERFMAVGALEPQFFGRVCALLGRDDLAALQYDPEGQAVLYAELAAVFASQPQQHWTNVFAEPDTCVTPVRSVREALGDASVRDRGALSVVDTDDARSLVAVSVIPWLADAERDPRTAPKLGADSDAVRAAARAGEWPSTPSPA